jgi:glycerol-3-phosphate acyltransferase PlsY
MMSPHFLLILLAAYLLGSIPSALIASRLLLGKDIRELGDGNMGAKNTFHSAGWLAGTAVAAADVTKGALAIAIAQGAHASSVVVMLAGVCAVFGHDFPVFAGFRGGQGMATILGVFAIILPQETILAVVALGMVLVLTRNWDLSCAAAFILLVSLIWVEGAPMSRLLYPFILLPTLGIRKIMQKWQGRPTTV